MSRKTIQNYARKDPPHLGCSVSHNISAAEPFTELEDNENFRLPAQQDLLRFSLAHFQLEYTLFIKACSSL
jgi:hypothetical protein